MVQPDKKGLLVDFESLVESHSHPFMVIDKDYRIVAVNQAFAESFKVRSDQVIGHSCHEVSHGNAKPCHIYGVFCPHIEVFQKGRSGSCTHEHRHAGDDMQTVHINACKLVIGDGDLLMGQIIEEVWHNNETASVSQSMVGESAAFRESLQRLTEVAGSDAPVLLEGETGVGKELAAEFIHSRSLRCNKPFQIIDSTVLNDGLFESEVFGHEKGAYTGNAGRKLGLFELAEGGTVFLDEIGELPLTQQAKFLRVLESGQFRRVGGGETLKANVRIICATNRNLWDSVTAGDFREDLYYRIACLRVGLPSLRERLEDIPILVDKLLENINRSMRSRHRLTPGALDVLRNYDYPGNIRELRNMLFIAATQSTDSCINAACLEKVMRNMPHCNQARRVDKAPGFVVTRDMVDAKTPASLNEIEKHFVQGLLDRYEGNRKKIAEALGVSERTVYRKLKKLRLN